ncbi:MAG: glycosyltransferase family 4 protein [Candidatus Nanopelagicales bacterium]|nr:glycosyltransferase family 4 protein [Candidatus Nanopelagicales bacterium]
MRIGIVCPYDWTSPGGVKAHVHDQALTLQRFGHEVSVLAPIDDDEYPLEDFVVDGGKPVSVPYNGSVAKVNFGPVSAARVRRWIKEGDFDVLHVHEPASPTLSVLACWAARGPIVATWHSSQTRSRALSAAYYLVQTAMEKISARIAVSEAARQTLVKHLGGDAVLIPNGVTCADYEDAVPLPGYPRTGPTIFFIGRIDEPRKGLQVLLAALPAIVADHPDVEVLVAGPGDQAEATEDLAEDLRGHLRFLGLVSDAEKVSAFASADVYVAPNTGGESFGIVLLEAMAAGTPVVASNLEAFARVLDDGRAGQMFVSEDAQDLARTVNALLSDPLRRDELRRAGHDRARQFDWEVVAREIEGVYESVTTTGERVENDMRGQFVGRLARPRDEA